MWKHVKACESYIWRFVTFWYILQIHFRKANKVALLLASKASSRAWAPLSTMAATVRFLVWDWKGATPTALRNYAWNVLKRCQVLQVHSQYPCTDCASFTSPIGPKAGAQKQEHEACNQETAPQGWWYRTSRPWAKLGTSLIKTCVLVCFTDLQTWPSIEWQVSHKWHNGLFCTPTHAVLSGLVLMKRHWELMLLFVSEFAGKVGDGRASTRHAVVAFSHNTMDAVKKRVWKAQESPRTEGRQGPRTEE